MTVKIFGILFIMVIISALVALFIIAKRIAKRNNISVWKALFVKVGENDGNRNININNSSYLKNDCYVDGEGKYNPIPNSPGYNPLDDL